MHKPDTDRDAIIYAIDTVFEALKNRDVEAWRNIFHPDGKWFVLSIDEHGRSHLEIDTTASRIRSLPTIDAGIEEVQADPHIEIDGSIATFWSTYRATLDGELIACGRNAFQLVKVDEQWLIANVMFTQRRDPCPE